MVVADGQPRRVDEEARALEGLLAIGGENHDDGRVEAPEDLVRRQLAAARGGQIVAFFG